jgi:hypothetical protein
MGFKTTTKFQRDAFGNLTNKCWDGLGANPLGIPRCSNEGGEGNQQIPPLGKEQISTDQNKLEGRQEWEYKIQILDMGQGYDKWIDPANVREMYYEEDCFTAFNRGYIVLEERFEGLQREPQDSEIPTWTFRNDGRDEIRFGLKPLTNETDLPPEVWEFENIYVIYDKEDLGGSAKHKVRKYYFWDKNYQLLRERKIQWSTATGTRFISPIPKEPTTHASDLERSMYTGEAIASLLYDAGFGDYIDFEYWDWGGSRIFYTTKANESVWEAIEYILKKHVDKEKFDQCRFSRNRWTRKYKLEPYWKIFMLAGKGDPGIYQKEHIFFEQTADLKYSVTNILESNYSDGTIISPWKAPLIEANSLDIDIKANEWGFITDYQFIDMAGIDNSIAMVTKPVHTHWHRNNQFIMNVETNEIENIREDFIKSQRLDYIKGNYLLYTLNKTKKDQIAIDPRYDLSSNLNVIDDSITRLNSGRNETAFANLFLNQAIGIKMYGSTHRIAGMFIGIDRIGYSDNDFDWKICGQWYVVRVAHEFVHDKYTNKLIMVKLHAYDEFKTPPNEDLIT